VVSGGKVVMDNAYIVNLTATNISANAITSDKITSNAITSNKIAANAITANKISSNSITSNKIAANAVTADKIVLDNATITGDGDQIKIRNLGVDTLQIADNAVIIPYAQTVTGMTTQGNGGYQEVQWINVTLDQTARLLIFWSASQFYGQGIRAWNSQLRINNVLKQLRGGQSVTVSPDHMYSEVYGPGTYRVAIWWYGQDSGVRIQDRTLVALGAKK